MPASAEVLVSWLPASCMPSPESPAKRTVAVSNSRTGLGRPAGISASAVLMFPIVLAIAIPGGIQFAVGNLEDAAHAASRGRAALERVGNAVAYASSIEGTVLATLGRSEDTRACLLRGMGGLREDGLHVHVAFAILLAWLAEQSDLPIEAGRLAAAIERVPPGEVDLGLLTSGLHALLASVSERVGNGAAREAISPDESVPLLEVILEVAPRILDAAPRH